MSIDPTGHIWVLENRNGNLVRMDDMNGTNWTVVGTAGSGIGQFGILRSVRDSIRTTDLRRGYGKIGASFDLTT